MAKFNVNDIRFVLKQIKIAEDNQHTSWDINVNGGIGGIALANLIADPLLSLGLRTVDGTFNNLLPGQENFGAADTVFPRLLPAEWRNEGDDTMSFGGPAVVTNDDYAAVGNTIVPNTGGFVVVGDVADADPRIISNLIVDQSNNNPAAIAAWHANDKAIAAYQEAHNGELPPANYVPTNAELATIPNIATDEGLSASYNSWFTLFGQFFDHGLDLVTKGGNGFVYIPLQPDDPLYVPGGHSNFMVVTRTTPVNGHEAINTTTSWIDQNQTYTSHPSHQAFLREYELDVNGSPVATGKLLEGDNGGLATWADIKEQARTMLGIDLSDYDIDSVPLLATDQYGQLILSVPGGRAQLVTNVGLVEGNTTNPVSTLDAVSTGHAFLDDIAHAAVPFYDHDGNPTTAKIEATADGDTTTGLFDDQGAPITAAGFYDDELLNAHYITGDGRGNENIGLTSVHHIFHSEHNRQTEEIKLTIVQDAIATGLTTDLIEWVPGFAGALPPANATPAEIQTFVDSLTWDGERIFQAARFATEMQYQHLVFEEFARKVQPTVNVFAAIENDTDAAIVAEFAHTVYRFGHSMLTETVDRIDEFGNPVLEGTEQIGLIEAFLNPLEYASRETTAGAAAAEVIRGMTMQTGNELDEFVTGALRNNLVGLPLDLAAINIARGRDTGIPSLNSARAQFFEMTGDSQLKAYTSWNDFGANIKHFESLVNFIAAYGEHGSVTSATTLDEKRAAAMLLVYGNVDTNGDGVAEVAPNDRLQFMAATGPIWGTQETGLNLVDFWIGGLAEKQLPFGGLLGSTFGFVFEKQMELLQDQDRLYYLARNAGLNFLTELEGNSFSELIMRNTPGFVRMGGDAFAAMDHILEVDTARQIGDDPVGQVVRNNPNTPGPDSNYLEFVGGEHVVLGGTDSNDVLIADDGDDTIWGDGGNDIIEGGAGNDMLNGGDGDDIIQDSFGDDNIKGGAGNDVINAGAGIDLIIAGDGNDFVYAGIDEKETFGGEGNDYIFAGNGSNTVFGDGGDDWIDGGEQADLLQGDNGDPFQTSQILGNDVVIGGSGNDDYDMEAGDDIAVTGAGVERYEGMLGFDWIIRQGDAETSAATELDLAVNGLALPGTLEALRDRADLVEAVSGWNFDDTLRGDNLTTVELAAIDPEALQNNALNSVEQISLIDGLQGLLDGMLGAGQTSFSAGNILLGGGGSDMIEGRGGNDLIDGDKWLGVQLSYIDANNVEQRTADIASLQAMMFAGTLKPGDLKIVREINDAADVGTDSAVYRFTTALFDGDGNPNNNINPIDNGLDGALGAEYSWVQNPNGTWTVTHNLVDAAGVLVTAAAGANGIDTLRNVEQLRFEYAGADGIFGDDVTTVGIDESLDDEVQNVLLATAPNVQNAVGSLTITPTTNAEENVQLTAAITGVADVDGINVASVRFEWQVGTETSPGVFDWATVRYNSSTFTPDDGQVGKLLRVIGRYEDNAGNLEEVITNVTVGVNGVINVNDAPSNSTQEVTVNEGGIYAFTELDFGFTDPDVGDSLSSVVIISLPTSGTLMKGVVPVPVIAGDEIIAADIGFLTFTPAPDANGADYASFDFTVRDQEGVASASQKMWVNVNTVNDAPTGTDNAVILAEDTTYTFVKDDFGFNDIDAGDDLRAVQINSLPSGGSLTLNGNAVVAGQIVLVTAIVANQLVYTPAADGNGFPAVDSEYANFDFTVQDLSGTPAAASNTMTINVTQVNDLATGVPLISDTTPTEGMAITVDTSAVDDIDGLSAFTYQWQSSLDGNNWVNVGGPTVSNSINPTQNEVNKQLRAVITFTDQDGNPETLTTAATTVVGDLYTGTSGINVRTLTNGQDVASGLAGADVLNGLGEDDLLNGGNGADVLNGGDGNDNLIGGTADAGADTLIGGAGIDRMEGGAGNDSYEVDNIGDQVIEIAGAGTDSIDTSLNEYSLNIAALGAVENLSFSGEGNFVGTGNAVVNLIEGSSGNDRLDGLAGNDRLFGGEGNDTYVVTQQGEAWERVAVNEGIDTVESSVTYSLASATTTTLEGEVYGLVNIENLTLTGTAVINGTGNALDNLIIGNSVSNTLTGNDGNDTMIGGDGVDTLIGGNGIDTLDGGNGNDIIRGGVGNDIMVGGQGNDVFDSTSATGTVNGEAVGDDTMTGGIGDDNYAVDSLADVVVEFAGEGTDIIRTSLASYDLSTHGANVENLTFMPATRTDALTGIGNALNNIITGAAGNDTLTGNAGNDTLNGGGGNDTFIATLNDGNDIYTGGANGITAITIGNFNILGDFLDMSLTMQGVSVTTSSASGAEIGSDTLSTGANAIENFIGGSGSDTINVNGQANYIDGGAGVDTINAGGANDILIGGLGNDFLNGGLGSDTFVFGLGFGNDQIVGSATERFDAVGGGSLLDQDLLDIRGLGITDFTAQVSITGDATNTLVSIVGTTDTIQLVGVNVADVTQQDFIVV